MVHGGSKSRRFGVHPWLAGGIGLIVFLAITAASGPADFVETSASSKSLPVPFAISPPFPSIPTHIETAPGVHTEPLGPISATSAVGAELLRDAPEIPASSSITIAANAVIPQVKTRTIWVDVTAYCPCKRCCGSYAKGITSSGKPITYNGGHFLAADLKLLPYGTRIIVPGYNNNVPVEVIDRGGAIRGYHIDIFMPTHQEAVEWGKKRLQAVVVE